MRKITLFFATALLSVLSLTSTAGDKVNSHTEDVISYLDNQLLARDQLAFELAPIKSKSDLDAYLRSTSRSKSPFDILSAYAKSQFINSLIFNKNGLVSFSYKEIGNELNAKQVYELLSLFGVQRAASLVRNARVDDRTDQLILSPSMRAPDDHEGYYCESQHTCSRTTGKICMSGC